MSLTDKIRKSALIGLVSSLGLAGCVAADGTSSAANNSPNNPPNTALQDFLLFGAFVFQI